MLERFRHQQTRCKQKAVPIAEINFPTEGLNRALSGEFAEDENGKVWVLHRSKIRGCKEWFSAISAAKRLLQTTAVKRKLSP